MSTTADDDVVIARSHLVRGDLASAAAALERALQHNPRHAQALHFMGLVAYQAGQPDKAIELLKASISINPHDSDVHSNLGTIALTAGQTGLAESSLRTAVVHDPSNPTFQFNYGNALAANGKLADAAQHLENAIRLLPSHAEAHNNLGIVYRDLEKLPDATLCFRKAFELKPDYSEAAYNLANAYRDLGRLTKAEATLRAALSISPGYAKAHNSLGNVLSESARSEEACDAFRRASELDPTASTYASNLLCCLQYVPGVTAEKLQSAHVQWAKQFTTGVIKHTHLQTPSGSPLVVGFVSPDFGRHPCGFLTVGMFEHLDHGRIRPIIFSTRKPAREDDISRRIATVTDWKNVSELADNDLYKAIQQASPDVLIDMSGHTSGHRLSVFARKPAPVQLSWLGYVGTTGLDAIDYIVADRWHAPEGQVPAGPESFLRLTDGYVCFDPPADVGDIAPLPALKNGVVTFGNLNNATKLNPLMIESYARILQQIPNSRLIFRFRGMDDSGVSSRILGAFSRNGVDAERVEILGYAKRVPFLQTYNDIDIGLDSFPYSGGLTTCEALWMGVPVVTFPGATFAGRHATSHMSNAGFGDFVAADFAGFERLAILKASDIQALSRLRATTRSRLLASPLCDGKRFADSFTAAIERAWKEKKSAS